MPARTPSSRLSQRNRVFEIRWELILILATMGLIMFALSRTARAETEKPTVRKHTTIITEKTEDVSEEEESSSASAEALKERVLTAKFGSKAKSGMAGCKTEELSQKIIRELKGDCNAWLKDRKSELKGKYLSGSCEESCDDCGMNLQRCNVEGSVRYTVR